MRLQREGGKRREPAAEADLEKQLRARIQADRAPRQRDEQAEHKCAEHIDDQGDEGEAALVPQGDEADQIAQHGADKASEADEYAV